MTSVSTASSTQHSNFVTGLAWIVIIMAGFTTFIAVQQNIMITTLMPPNMMPSPTDPAAEHMPWFMRFMIANMRWFFMAVLVLAVATLASAIGLLRRKEWSRIAIIALLSLGIVWNVASILVQQSMFAGPAMVRPSGPPEFRAEFERMTTTAFALSVVLALAMSALFAWLIKRLSSAPIRAEFTSAP